MPSVGDRMNAAGERVVTTSDSAEWAIEIEGLVKEFAGRRAVDGISLRVRAGEVHGFLGPNGAGKTTTIRVLATLVRPDGGTARVFGQDVVLQADAVRSRIALTGQFASVDEDLTAAENLVLMARISGCSRSASRVRAEQLLSAFGLVDAASRQVRNYSGGMRRRLDIAASMVVRPDLIFLDEPTTGLDPRSRNEVWEIVRDLVATGTTVLLTTQYLEEADQLADRISVIESGRLVATGTAAELKGLVGSGTLHIRVRDLAQRRPAQDLLHRVLAVAVREGADPAALDATVNDAGRAAHALAELSSAGIAVTQFSLGHPSLDEVFLALTGRAVPAVAADSRKGAA
jgi:ABC-2 type transport system ATP-binding protein